ncbi:hypothetical protein niasHS_004170 [Heterodera schachtii]|uniref:B30.2/SPRY domain-containing protein n=1 Tax=Heterodera schachtii TaxID=97005 RepID=A0ABD2JZZ7_HETSC
MSISTNSINYGDDFTQAENGVNSDAISLDIDGNSESIVDFQQLKEFGEKFAKMEMELKMAKLELENKALEQKLKHEEMMGEQKALKEKVAKIEQKKEKNAIFQNLSTLEEMSVLIARIAELNRAKTIEPSIASSCDLSGQNGNDTANQLSKILEKINELEKQQKEQSKANANQLSKILEKISELEKEQKQTKANSNFRQNLWDVNVCHENLKIIGNKSLTVHYKGNVSGLWRSVFAKHPILLNNDSSDIFYYEISVKKINSWYISFGFAVKQRTELDGAIRTRKGTYAYENDGEFLINGEEKGMNAEYPYGVGDTVGIGVNSATRQIIFTKNGLRLDSSGFFVAPYLADADDLFHPFVMLASNDDKIEANFGPKFKFDLVTL